MRDSSQIRHEDHPRIRGEHRKYQQDKAWRSGSSPHTRGARAGVGDAGVEVRIIPAYAGSTKIAQKGKGMAADHPRIRGEHITQAGRLRPPRGSSPHTRGARELGLCVPGSGGIIPAYAGSTT